MAPYFYFAQYYNVLFNGTLLALWRGAYGTQNKLLDKGFVEYFGPYGVYKGFYAGAHYVRRGGPGSLVFSLALMVLALGALGILWCFHGVLLGWLTRDFALVAVALGLVAWDWLRS